MSQLSYYPTHIAQTKYVFPDPNISFYKAYDPDPDFITENKYEPLHRIHVWKDEDKKHLFFVCRGTQSKRDWIHPDRQINAGIGFESDRIRETLRELHKDLHPAAESYTLFTIGHSLGGFLANAAAIITYQNKQYKYTNTFTKAIAIPFQPFYSSGNNDQHWKSLNWGFQENKSYVVNVQNDFAAIALVTAINNNEICNNVHILEIPRLPKSQIPGVREFGQQFYKANTHCLFNFLVMNITVLW